MCLDADSGAVVWRHTCELPYDAAGLYPGPRSTPTFSQGRIYYAGPRGTVGCLLAHDGTKVWSLNVIEQFDGHGFDFGYAASPLVENGLVVLPAGGPGASVVALDADDGSTVWTSGDQPASYCSAIPITFRGQRHVVVFLQNALASFDLKSGRPLWEHVFSQGYNEHSAMPLYQEPLLMTMSPFRSGSVFYPPGRWPFRPREEPADRAERCGTGRGTWRPSRPSTWRPRRLWPGDGCEGGRHARLFLPFSLPPPTGAL